MTALAYVVSVFQLVPQQEAATARTEVGVLAGAYGLNWTEKLNRPAELTIGFLPENQSAEVVAALTSPAFEIQVARDGVVVFTGPGVVKQAASDDSGVSFSLQCRDVLHYLWRRMLDPAAWTEFKQVDQVTIAKSLIDTVQADDYSDFGIVTDDMVPVGVLRDRTYEWGEFHVIGDRITELAQVANGFDWWIDPATRRMKTEWPRRGVDVSETVVLDRASIMVASASWVWGVEDYVSHAYAISKGQDEFLILGEATNPNVLTAFGRADVGASYQDVTQQDTIDDHAGALAADRAAVLYLPAPQVQASGFEAADLVVGNTVEVSYDYGLGLEVVEARIVTLATMVGDDGNETFSLELV